MPDNLIPINGGGKPDKTREALRQMREGLAMLIEYQQLNAQLIRARYDALLKQGFSESQAIELCKAL